VHQYFGIWSDFGFVLIGLSALVLSIGSVWLRLKRLFTGDREHVDHSARDRLERIEQIVEASALEIERMAESQRFTTKLLVERGTGLSAERSAARTVTPH
jgi:hypothetical protein